MLSQTKYNQPGLRFTFRTHAAPLTYTLTASSVKAIAEIKVVKFNYSQ
jgi:hypothetical protein